MAYKTRHRTSKCAIQLSPPKLRPESWRSSKHAKDSNKDKDDIMSEEEVSNEVSSSLQDEADKEEEDYDVHSTSGSGDTATNVPNKRKRAYTGWKVFLADFSRDQKVATSTCLSTSFNMPAVMKLASERWKSMTEQHKEQYKEIAAKERAEVRSNQPKERKKMRLATINTRCSPRLFNKFISGLSETQNRVVQEMGFGGLLHLKCTIICRSLCKWLVEHFDTTNCCLCIDPLHVYPITPTDVEMVLGIPASGIDVPLSGQEDEIHQLRVEYNALKTGVPYSVLQKDLQSGDAGDRFRRSFVLYTLGILLCPTLRLEVCSKLFPAVVNVGAIPTYNWSKFVLQWLVREAKSYRAGIRGTWLPWGLKKSKVKGKKSGLGGCLLFLMLFYFDRAKCIDVAVPRDSPRIKGWTNELVRKWVNQEREFGHYGGEDDIFGGGQASLSLSDFPTNVDLTNPVIVTALKSIFSMQHQMSSAISMATRQIASACSASVSNPSTRPVPLGGHDVHGPPNPSIQMNQNPTQTPIADPANDPSTSTPIQNIRSSDPKQVKESDGAMHMMNDDLLAQHIDATKPHDYSEANAWYIPGRNPDPFPAELNVGLTEEVEHLSSAGFKVSEDSIKQAEASDPPHLQMRAQRIVRPGALTVSPYQAAPRLVICPPTTDEKAVYAYATRRTTDESDKKEVLVDMLDTCAQQSAFAVEMVPRGWLSNHLLHLACKVIMEADKQRHGYITRHIFSPYFSEDIVVEFPDNVSSEQPVWSVARVEKFIKPPLLSHSISKYQMIFVPVLFQRHWICYVVNLRDRSVDVLDSMIKGRTKVHEELDDRVRERLDQVLHHAEEHLEFDIKSFPIKVAQVPQQSNKGTSGTIRAQEK